MIFKSFSHISRHAALAKSIWVSSGNTPQPAFFAKPTHLARQQQQQQQQQPRSSNSALTGIHNGYSSLCSSSSFATHEDDKRRDAILAESTGSGSYLIHNHQHSLSAKGLVPHSFTRRRRFSTSSLDLDKTKPPPNRRRRYSVSRADLHNHLANLHHHQKSTAPKTPPSSPVVGPVNASNQLVEAEIDLLQLVDPPHNGSHRPDPALGSMPQIEPSPQLETQSLTSASPTSSLRSDSTQTSLDVADYPKDTQTILLDQLAQSILSSSIPSVIASYHLLKSHNIQITAQTCEKIVSFLSANILNDQPAQNLNTILSIYMDFVSTQHPTNKIYSAVISSLLTLADHSKTKESSLAYYRITKRHPKTALSSILASLNNGDSSASLQTAALDIFEASNSVKSQKYSADLYQSILQAVISTSRLSLLYPITRMLEINGCTLTPDIFILLIQGFGKHGDMKAAVETYKHYKALAGSLVDRKEFEIYAALIGAYFDSANPKNGLTFFAKVQDNAPEPAALSPVISEIVQAYCRIGDYRSAFAWIKRIDNNPALPPVPSRALEVLLSASSDAGDVTISEAVFDLIPCKEFARSDFVALCVKSNEADLLRTCINESRVAGGAWDLSTVMLAVKYLISIGDVQLALLTFQVQGSKYIEHLTEANLDHSGHILDALNSVVRELQASNNLNVSTAMTLMDSDFFDAQVFSNDGGIACIRTIWEARASGSLPALDSHSIINLINTHLQWIQVSGANNSLGGLSIPTPLLDELRPNFAALVHQLIAICPTIDSTLRIEVSLALEVLGDHETASAWSSFCDRPVSSAPITWNQQASDHVISTSKVSLSNAMDALEEAVSNGDLLNPQAFICLIEAAQDELSVKHVYKTALSALPNPSEHPEALDAWITIHQAAVKSAHIAYSVASAAYDHLLRLGAFPDANGYAQLILGAPASSSTQAVADALYLFNEARENAAVNTFLYNVVLSKLAKARQLQDAVACFNDMDATKTKKNAVTYATMINASCRAGDEASATAIFRSMEAQPDYIPKIAPFNIMLQFYVHVKRDRAAALRLYNKMRTLVKPSTHTYKLVIEAYGTIAPIDINAADKVLLQIIADGGIVNSKHHAALLFARGVCMKSEQDAQDFYYALIHNSQVRPDKHIFRALLESHVVNKKVRSTAHVLKDMVNYGIDMDAPMANILIRGWAPVNLEKARGLFDHMVQEGVAEPSTFESIILAYLYYGDVASAYVVLNLMAAQLYPEPALAKLQALIEANAAAKVTEDYLLGSIVTHTDAHIGPTFMIPDRPQASLQF